MSGHPGHRDLRLVAPAAAAWVGAWVGTSGMVPGWVTGALLVPLVAALGAWRRWPLVVGVALAGGVCLAGGAAHAHQLETSPLRELGRERAAVTIDYRVEGDPQVSTGRFGESTTVPVTVVAVDGRGRGWVLAQAVQLRASGDRARVLRGHEVGSRWSAGVRLAAAEPGEPRAAYATVTGTPQRVAAPGPVLRAAEHVRAGLRQSMRTSAPEPRALVPSLVVGDTSLMSDELRRDFRATGLTHLTAVSGANLAIMLACLLGLARWIGVRGRGIIVVGISTVAAFVLLCRAEPSVLRAAAMGLVMLAALGANPGAGKGLRHLAVATLGLLFLDPWLGRSAGFALSVLASGGIIACAAAWRDTMAWLPRPIAESVAVPLAAQVATQPVVTALSGEVSVVGLVANAATGPLVGPATVLGFVTAALAPVCRPAAEFTGWLAGWCAQGILWVAHAGAALPGATWRWPAGTVGLLLVTLGSVAGVGVAGAVLARRWLALACAAGLVWGLARAPMVPGWPPPGWSVMACDVGQGDAVLLNAANGQAVLVDTGPDPRPLAACLDSVGVTRIALLVLTHYHADHAGGLDAAWPRLRGGHVLVSPLASPLATAEGVVRRASAAGASTSVARPGERWSVGAVRWTTLGPLHVNASAARATARGGESPAENDASVVGRAEVGRLSVLLTGDIEPAGQEALVRGGVDLRADVLKVPHHGSARQSADFVTAVAPRAALIGVGAKNDYGHPAPSALRLLGERGATILRTDLQGGLAVAGDPASPRLTTQR